ncbi:MAG: cation transporter, partial [Deltaproteobacteria bacterium]|nr:cation transporter [Deltaproteobacteria bacterium]
MKTVSAVLALLFFVFIAANPLFAGETKSVTLKVEGMTCSLCPKMVKKALSGIEGVKAVQVSFEKK